ncbi:MAG TPA: prepilin-type N-terminal cleavage/methylation domain-containing protein [Candidatus Limnocylindrales bacterium]|nr:prepilin-type N-terminal cleavage/methylation domain-containing protein [Candidatus Limnocylindrales bacterium]
MARIERTDKRKASTAFTLVEVVMSIGILSLVMGGMIFGYVQTNHRTEWSSMSLDAQSFATEAIEQARAAQLALGGGTVINQYSQPPFSNGTYTRTNTMLIPSTGRLTNVVTTVSITNLSSNPTLYQFRADCVWYFPGRTNKFTNTIITWRAPDR